MSWTENRISPFNRIALDVGCYGKSPNNLKLHTVVFWMAWNRFNNQFLWEDKLAFEECYGILSFLYLCKQNHLTNQWKKSCFFFGTIVFSWFRYYYHIHTVVEHTYFRYRWRFWNFLRRFCSWVCWHLFSSGFKENFSLFRFLDAFKVSIRRNLNFLWWNRPTITSFGISI